MKPLPGFLKALLDNIFITLFFASVLVGFTACGKRRPPLPPNLTNLPQAQLTGFQRGEKVVLQINPPADFKFNRVDFFRLAEAADAPLFLTEEEFASRSTLIGSAAAAPGPNIFNYTDALNLIGFNRRLRYAVRFVNPEGQRSGFSNFYLLEPAANIARAPVLEKFTVTAQTVKIEWQTPVSNVDDSKPANVIGYNIYRSKAERQKQSVTPEQLNGSPLPDDSFEDRNFQFGEEYVYIVRAVSAGADGAQVESDDSNSLRVAPRDVFPPARPEGLTIAAAPGSLSLFFAANNEPDVSGYKIYRSTDERLPLDKWELLTPSPVTATTFQDSRIEPGKRYFYYVTALDAAGNASQPSEIVGETAP